jgi:hypothetical protein
MWLQRWWGRSTKTHKTTRDVAAAWRSLGSCAPQRQSRQAERAFRALRARPFPHPRSQFNLSFLDVTSKLGFGSPVHFIKKKGWQDYPATLAASTLILLFSEMLKFSNLFCSNNQNLCEAKWNLCEGKCWILENILFVSRKISKLINNLTYMCWSCQGTAVSNPSFQ